MCNSENYKCNLRWIPWHLVPSYILVIACLYSSVLAQSPPFVVVTPDASFDINGVRSLFEEARVSASLKQGRSLSFEQLSEYPARYRVLLEQLQSRFIAKQVSNAVKENELSSIASQLLGGLSLSRAVISRANHSGRSDSVEQLASQLKTSQTRVVDVITLAVKKHHFINALLANLPTDYMLINWFEQSLQVEFEAITIPRVPTSREIDRAVLELRSEITRVYKERPGRFNKPRKILATRIRVPWLQNRSNGADSQVRGRAAKLLRAREDGDGVLSLLERAGDDYALRKKGHVTLNARKHPKLAKLNKGERSGLFEDDRGVGFYEIKMQAPAYTRKLTDQTVQRELAAELLRQRDTLPNAYRKAQAIADTWVSSPDLVDQRLKNIQGSRRIPSSRFAPYVSALIPGLGTAELGAEQIQQLQRNEVSGHPVWIRQDYVVFRVAGWQVPILGEWWQKAPAYWAEYEPKARQQLIHQWLTREFPKNSVEVDGEVISKMVL
jgi:hypothetical protein